MKIILFLFSISVFFIINGCGDNNSGSSDNNFISSISGNLSISNSLSNTSNTPDNYTIALYAYNETADVPEAKTSSIDTAGNYSFSDIPSNTSLSFYIINSNSISGRLNLDESSILVSGIGLFSDERKLSLQSETIALQSGAFSNFTTAFDEDTGFALTEIPDDASITNANVTDISLDPKIDIVLKYLHGNFNLTCGGTVTRTDYSSVSNMNTPWVSFCDPDWFGYTIIDYRLNPVKITTETGIQFAIGMWSSPETFATCGETEGLDNLNASLAISSITGYTDNSNMLAPFQWDTTYLPSFSSLDVSTAAMATIQEALIADITNWNGYEDYNTNTCVPNYGNTQGSRTVEYCVIHFYTSYSGNQNFFTEHCIPDIEWYFDDSGNHVIKLATTTGSKSRPVGKYAFMEVDKKGPYLTAKDHLYFVSGYSEYDQTTENSNFFLLCHQVTETTLSFKIDDITSENMNTSFYTYLSPYQKYFSDSNDNAAICSQGHTFGTWSEEEVKTYLIKTAFTKNTNN